MELTFRKNVDGKNLQFNRLLYPVRYIVKLDEYGSSGEYVEFKPDANGAWKPFIDGQSELWFKEKSKEISSIIAQNEG